MGEGCGEVAGVGEDGGEVGEQDDGGGVREIWISAPVNDGEDDGVEWLGWERSREMGEG